MINEKVDCIFYIMAHEQVHSLELSRFEFEGSMTFFKWGKKVNQERAEMTLLAFNSAPSWQQLFQLSPWRHWWFHNCLGKGPRQQMSLWLVHPDWPEDLPAPFCIGLVNGTLWEHNSRIPICLCFHAKWKWWPEISSQMMLGSPGMVWWCHLLSSAELSSWYPPWLRKIRLDIA